MNAPQDAQKTSFFSLTQYNILNNRMHRIFAKVNDLFANFFVTKKEKIQENN